LLPWSEIYMAIAVKRRILFMHDRANEVYAGTYEPAQAITLVLRGFPSATELLYSPHTPRGLTVSKNGLGFGKVRFGAVSLETPGPSPHLVKVSGRSLITSGFPSISHIVSFPFRAGKLDPIARNTSLI
jgi:hypothetical protein